MEPPPLPPSANASRNSFAHQAARASWLAPVLALGISIIGDALTTLKDHFNSGPGPVVVGVCGVLIIMGFLLGVSALCMAKGRKGVLGHALTGTLLCAFFILVGLVSARMFNGLKQQAEANRASLAKVIESSKEVTKAVENNLQAHPGPDQSSEKLKELQNSLLDAAQNMDGEGSLAFRSGSAYVEKLNLYKSDYDSAVTALKKVNVLSAASVKEKSDLAARREAVQNFLHSNAKLKDFIAHGEENFRAEFDRLHVAQNVTQSALASYNKKADLINPVIVSVRDADEKIGEAMLGIIDIEETNWGHWKVSAQSGKIRFESDDLPRRYNALLYQIRESRTNQMLLERKLLQLTKQLQ